MPYQVTQWGTAPGFASAQHGGMFLRALIAGLACLQAVPDAQGQTTRRPAASSAYERPEREYVPQTYNYRNPPPASRPSQQNRPAPMKSVHIQPRQEQPKHSWTKAEPRDADLARCDDLRRRYESAMRAESRTEAERKSIYQQQVRAGC